MFRSTYLIGLGGTGQWILTYLKKELLEINQGTPPVNVKLLAIDTQMADIAVAGANAANIGSDRKDALTDARLGDVHLDRQIEFLQIGKPLSTFIQQIHDDRLAAPERQEYKYLNWVDTEELLELGEAGTSTIWGAGAFRQLGRLSLFHSAQEVFNKISIDLEALKETLEAGSDSQELEIIMACSVAGGTGAGTLVDVAWLVREAARRKGIPINLRAFILMPTTWDLGNPEPNKKMRAFATWSELDRFMISKIAIQGHTKIVFNPNTRPPLQVDCDKPVFDTTYIIDPNRENNAITPPPENGTFPAVAQAISFIIDKVSGHYFAAHIPNVKNEGKVTLPPGVYHSSIGTYTLKVPVYRARAKFSRELAFASFEKLIQPVLSATDRGIGLRSDRNRENPQNTAAAVTAFLTAGAQEDRKGQPVNNTALLPHLEDVYQKTQAGTEALATYVLNEANNIVDRRGNTFIAYVERVPLTSNEDEINRKIDILRREMIWQTVKPSAVLGKTPAQNYPDLVAKIKTSDVEWFGQSSVEKVDNQTRTVRTTEGSRAKILREIRGRQIETYQILLRTWIDRTLNGIHHDPIIRKEGKLGYVKASLEELSKRLSAYDAYLNALKQRINDSKTLITRTKNTETTLFTYNTLKGKKCILCFYDQNVHPRAREAERDYLRKVQKLFDVYLSEQFIRNDQETLAELASFTQKTLQEVQRWAELLVVGQNTSDKEKDYAGLYNHMRDRINKNQNDLRSEMKQGNPDFAANRNLRGVLQIIRPQLAQSSYQNNRRWEPDNPITPYNDDGNIRAIFEQIEWKVDVNNVGEIILGCGFTENGQTTWMNNAATEEKVEENYFTWLQKSQTSFMNLSADNPIDTEIPKDFPNASDLANNIIVWADPMYSRRPVSTGAYDKCVFLRVDDTRNRSYFDQMRQRLIGISAGPGWRLDPNVPPSQPNSTDPFKLTLVHAEHLMPTEDFQIWLDMRNLFMKTVANPEKAADPMINFVYSAEKNAMELASKKPTLLQKNFEPFDPMIVSLLENQEHTLMFFLAYAQGLLKRPKTTSGSNSSWVYNDEVYLYEASFLLTGGRPPSIFDILRYWTVGKDIRPDKSEINKIDFNKVREAIVARENKNKKDVIVKIYQSAIDSMDKLIEEDRANQKRLLSAADMQYFKDQRYSDLKDLAKIFYLQSINRIKGL